MSSDCLNCGSIGARLQLLVEDAGGTFDANSERYEILAEDVGVRDKLVGGQGLTGSLGLNAAHLREGPSYVAGTILMNVSGSDLNNWLPRILGGGAATLNVFSVGETLPKFDMLIKRDNVTFEYTDCVITAALFRGDHSINEDEPHLIQMALSIIAETEAKGTFPDPAPSLSTTGPLYWLFADSTLTLGGTDIPFNAFNLLINNQVTPIHRNSLTPVCVRSMGREVRFRPQVALCEATADDVYFTRLDGAAVLSFDADKYIDVASTDQTMFTMGRVVNTRKPPKTRGRTEIPLELDLQAFINGSDGELEVTNVVT